MITIETLKNRGICDELIDDIMFAENILDSFIDNMWNIEVGRLHDAMLMHRFAINLLNDNITEITIDSK